MAIEEGLVLLVTSDGIGRGDDDLGRLLMHRFLHELGTAATLPERLLFMNSGVKLVVDDSAALGQIERIEESGVQVFACSTCLDRFGLIDRIAVGSSTDMSSTVTALTGAKRVVTL